MAGLSLDHPAVFIFGILGNLVSIMVYLAPLPTFFRVYRKRSTEGFQSIPYLVALFSSMLWICYALVKTDAVLLVTINSIGCIIETCYILIYLRYAPTSAKIFTARILLLLNVGLFGLILLLTLLLSTGSLRVRLLGWICMCFSVSVFVAPLSIIRLVVKTKSVEFMPFSLSFFLTLSAIVWFGYGYVTKDNFVLIPNILGFAFGLAQMVLYLIFNDKREVIQEPKCPENIVTAVKTCTTPGCEVHPIEIVPGQKHREEEEEDRMAHEPTDGGDEESMGAQVETEMCDIV